MAGISARRYLTAILGSVVVLAGLCGAPRAAETMPHLVIATYAGVGEKLWREVVAVPFAVASGIPTDVFPTTLPAALIAQAEGHPQFDVAIIAPYSAPGLVKRGLIEELTPDDIPGIRNVPEKY